MVKAPIRDTLSWQVASGAGNSNLHYTGTLAALANLHTDMGTLVGFSAGTTMVDAFDPAPRVVAYYRVFGAGNCSGLSYFP